MGPKQLNVRTPVPHLLYVMLSRDSPLLLRLTASTPMQTRSGIIKISLPCKMFVDNNLTARVVLYCTTTSFVLVENSKTHQKDTSKDSTYHKKRIQDSSYTIYTRPYIAMLTDKGWATRADANIIINYKYLTSYEQKLEISSDPSHSVSPALDELDLTRNITHTHHCYLQNLIYVSLHINDYCSSTT